MFLHVPLGSFPIRNDVMASTVHATMAFSGNWCELWVELDLPFEFDSGNGEVGTLDAIGTLVGAYLHEWRRYNARVRQRERQQRWPLRRAHVDLFVCS